MSASAVYELVGYAGSAFVILALTRTSILKLRMLSLAGAVTFLAYGVLIVSIPIVITNIVIVGINGFFLFRIYTTTEYFRFLEVRPESRYLAYFLDFYSEDIAKFVPDFRFDPAEAPLCFFVLRDAVPASLLIAEPYDDDGMLIRLDYAVPGYRDFRTGKYVYSKVCEIFQGRNCERVYSEPGNPAHEKYLRKMGFAGDGALLSRVLG